MKTILITGASGLLGSHIVKQLVGSGNRIIVSILPAEKEIYQPLESVEVILNDDIFDGKLPHVDVVINCAFARSNNAVDLASGLDFTRNLIKGFEICDIDGVINISSQGVYKRLPMGEFSKETSPIEPIDLYSMAKYSVEKMFEISKLKHYTNVRLSSINMRQRFLFKFVQCIREGVPISLNSPNVYASLLDVKDAASALVALAMVPVEQWNHTYNLGTGKQYSLQEFAETVQRVGLRLGYDAGIDINDNGNSSTAGMDTALLEDITGWKPIISNEMMIEEMFSW